MPHNNLGDGAPLGRSRALSLRAVLLLVILIPTAGLVLLTVISAGNAFQDRGGAELVERDANLLVDIIDARAAIADEETASGVLAIGADLGVDAARMSELYDVDYLSVLDAARTRVDAAEVLSSSPMLEEELAALAEVREQLDSETATFAETNAAFIALTTQVDRLWEESFHTLRDEMDEIELPGGIFARLDALHDTFLALRAGSEQVIAATRMLLTEEPSDADAAALIAARSQYEAITGHFDESLGTTALDTWRAHIAEPATIRFEATLSSTAESALTGEPSELSLDPGAFGVAFADGAPWSAGLTATVTAAAEDLRDSGTRQAAAATRSLQLRIGGAITLTLVAVLAALLLAKRVSQPVRRLERSAQQIREGRFDLEPLPPTGPRELADTATAFNEMASTLSAVEAHAVALADDTEAPILSESLPGRTGRALQVALNRLRSSMQVAEARRQELQQAATHDALTGLLNRAAAFEMIERDLARIKRDGGTAAALFIDLDGLKPINDQHGHAAGDDALRLTADALRAATRSSDVVARLGGDEFLVAGVLQDGPSEVEELAERIRVTVAAQEVACPDQRIPLRCSIGIAMASEDATAEGLVNEADAALYEAKRRGRNQIAWSPGAPASPHHDS